MFLSAVEAMLSPWDSILGELERHGEWQHLKPGKATDDLQSTERYSPFEWDTVAEIKGPLEHHELINAK